MKGNLLMSEIYLDNSATTKVNPKAAETAFKVMTEVYGNPSSIHDKGNSAAKLMLKARNDIIASFFGQQALKKLPKIPGFLGGEEYGRLIFTSCGTESNNLAISSVIESCKIASPRIITSDSEHPAVLRCFEKWAEKGCDVVYLSTKNGVIDENELINAVNKNTVLVSIMYVNNETGAIYDLPKHFKTVKDISPDIICHTDCVQAYQKIEVSPSKLNADMITISGHKVHAPKGIGALWVKNELIQKKRIIPILNGGGQESGLRSGTENLPGIAAFAEAVNINGSDKAHITFSEKVTPLRNLMIENLDPSVKVNQPLGDHVPHILSLTMPGQKSQPVLNMLSRQGIYVSSGSACSSHKNTVSHVLTAFGLSSSDADSTIRVSLDSDNTEEEILTFCRALNETVKRLAKK